MMEDMSRKTMNNGCLSENGGIDPIKTTRKKAMPPGRILGVQKIS